MLDRHPHQSQTLALPHEEREASSDDIPLTLHVSDPQPPGQPLALPHREREASSADIPLTLHVSDPHPLGSPRRTSWASAGRWPG